MAQAGGIDIAARLAEVRAGIATAASEAGRAAQTVTLVAVSKTHPASAVTTALAAGQKVFGENRVQEAQGKFPALKAAHPALRLHRPTPLRLDLQSEEHTSELQSLMRISYAVFCLKKKKIKNLNVDTFNTNTQIDTHNSTQT